MKTIKAILILAAALLLFYPVSSKADTIGYDLNLANAALSGFAGPYLHLEINRTSTTTATLTFTSLTNINNQIFLMAGQAAADVNVNGAFTLGAITASNSGTGFSTVSADFSGAGAGNVDGFGTFNLNIDGFDGFTHSADFLRFSLTKTSGTWASADSVLALNAAGYLAAGHGFVTTTVGGVKASNGALATGFVAVPEPGILILLGIAMSAIGAASWKIRKL